MEELIETFGSKDEAEIYARGLLAGLEYAGEDAYVVRVGQENCGAWKVTPEYVY
jgi:hypothetical protein